MYKLFILSILTLLGMVYVSLIAKNDPGYALISYGNWSVEMTLVLLIAMVAAAVLVFLLAVYLLLKLLDLPFNLGHWRLQRKTHQAYQYAVKGFIKLAEGQYKQAQRLLGRELDKNEMALANYFALAKAAHQQQQYDTRDEYIKQAVLRYPQAEIACNLELAQLQIDARQYQDALITLLHLRTIDARHKRVLQLLQQVYQHTQAWKDLQALLGDLRHSRALGVQQQEQLEISVVQQVLSDFAEKQDFTQMQAYWQGLERNLKRHPELVCHYAELLYQGGFDQ